MEREKQLEYNRPWILGSGQILMYTDIRTAGIILRHRYLPTTDLPAPGKNTRGAAGGRGSGSVA